MILKNVVFDVKAPVGGLLVGMQPDDQNKEKLLALLSELESNTVLILDFDSIRFMDVTWPDDVLIGALRGIESGEYGDIFMILANVKGQHRSNLNYVLTARGKAVIVDENTGPRILGKLIDSFEKPLLKLMELGCGTARELQEAMGYNTVNEASTKLCYLHQRRLIAREPVGGRKYKYFSLLDEALSSTGGKHG